MAAEFNVDAFEQMLKDAGAPKLGILYEDCEAFGQIRYFVRTEKLGLLAGKRTSAILRRCLIKCTAALDSAHLMRIAQQCLGIIGIRNRSSR